MRRRARRYQQVLMANDHARQWQEGIEHAHVFFVLLSPAYLQSPLLRTHLAYARDLGKPFRVAVIHGAEIPEGLFDGVADLEIRACATPAEVAAFVREAGDGRRG